MRMKTLAFALLLVSSHAAQAQENCADCRVGPEVPAKICCPPVAGDKALLAASFAYDQQSNESIGQHYGLTFTPAPALNTQMQLWTPFALSAYAAPGWTGVGIVMWADMRTDGPAPGTGPVNPSWPPTAGDWAAGTSIQPNTPPNPPGMPLGLWFASGSPWIFSSVMSDAALPKPTATAHMEANGRRYMIDVSYYIYERRLDRYRLRKVCDGGLLGVRLNVASMLKPPGGSARGTKKPPLEIAAAAKASSAPDIIIPSGELLRMLQKNGKR